MQQALMQDSTIYQYDEVYEDIKDKNTKPEVKKEERKTVSTYYIHNVSSTLYC